MNAPTGWPRGDVGIELLPFVSATGGLVSAADAPSPAAAASCVPLRPVALSGKHPQLRERMARWLEFSVVGLQHGLPETVRGIALEKESERIADLCTAAAALSMPFFRSCKQRHR